MTYTLEIYFPPFPNREMKARIHRGTFEQVRDNLSPDMMNTFMLDEPNRAAARARAREIVASYCDRRDVVHVNFDAR